MLKSDDFPNREQYEAARVSLGEICYRCQHEANLDPPGHRDLCYLCFEIETLPGAVSHDHHVRCPQCRKHWSPSDEKQIQVYVIGEHEVACPFCLHRFHVQTHATYHIASPALVLRKDNPCLNLAVYPSASVS